MKARQCRSRACDSLRDAWWRRLAHERAELSRVGDDVLELHRKSLDSYGPARGFDYMAESAGPEKRGCDCRTTEGCCDLAIAGHDVTSRAIGQSIS